MRVIVLGGTGAIGRECVALLVALDDVESVKVLSRRSIEGKDAILRAFPITDDVQGWETKLSVEVVDYENLSQSTFQGFEAVFCCLGTTAKDAGSSKGRHKVDYDYVLWSAQHAKKHNAQLFSLVTSAGANANSMMSYMKTKGQIEEATKALSFPFTSIWRPGLLDRKEKARFVERIAKPLVGSMPVDRVALAMVNDLRVKFSEAGGGSDPVVGVYDNKAINEFAEYTPKGTCSVM